MSVEKGLENPLEKGLENTLENPLEKGLENFQEFPTNLFKELIYHIYMKIFQ